MGKMLLRSFGRLLGKGVAAAGVRMDVDQTRPHIGVFRIDHAVSLGQREKTHLAVILDESVLDEKITFRDEVILHHQLCIDDCDHMFSFPD